MTAEPDANEEQRERVPLSRAAQYLLEECRMVLPGIQALFGFQLIAVFSLGFAEKLTLAEQRLHLVAIALLAIAVALIMATGGISSSEGTAGNHQHVHPPRHSFAFMDHGAVGFEYLH
jgi:hypothetical protein